MSVCETLLRSSERVIGDPFLKKWSLNSKECAIHIDNPSAWECLPEDMRFEMKTYMSTIGVGYPEYPEWLSEEKKIGVELPSCRPLTEENVKSLEAIGCRVTAVHHHEVDHIHALCPTENAPILIRFLDRARLTFTEESKQKLEAWAKERPPPSSRR